MTDDEHEASRSGDEHEIRRTVYINRLPLPVSIAMILLGLSALIASVGLVSAQHHSQDEVADLRSQVTELQGEAKTLGSQSNCRAQFANALSSAEADKLIAIGDGQGLLEDFLIALIGRDQATIQQLKTKLAAHHLALDKAGVELRAAVEAQRRSLASSSTC